MKSKDASASDFGRKSNTPTQTEGQLTKEFLFFKLENFLDSVLFFFFLSLQALEIFPPVTKTGCVTVKVGSLVLNCLRCLTFQRFQQFFSLYPLKL